MTYENKVQFIENVIRSTRDQLMDRIDSIPENWSNHDLRDYISSCINEVSCI